MRVCEPYEQSAMTVALPCDECGAKVRTVRLTKMRLCEVCLARALRTLSPPASPTVGHQEKGEPQ